MSDLEIPLKRMYLATVERQARNLGIPFKYYLVESGGTRIAIPDTFVILGPYSGWIEVKHIPSVERPVVKYEPGQLNELRVLRLYGVFSATLGLTSGQDYVLALPNKCLLSSELETKKVSLYSAKEYFTGDMSEQLKGLLFMMKRFYAERNFAL